MEPITLGAIGRILNNEVVPSMYRPVVQVIDVRRIASASGGGAGQDRFRLVVSDSEHYSPCMAASQLNQLINDSALTDGCMVRLENYLVNRVQGRGIIVVLGITVLSESMDRIGEPTACPAAYAAAGGGAPAPAVPVPAPTLRVPTAAAAAVPTNLTSFGGAPARNDDRLKELLHELVDEGDYVNQAAKNGATLTFFAAENGHLELLGLLVEKGFDVDEEGMHGTTLALIAAEKGHLEVLGLLIEKGANVNRGNIGNDIPLLTAVGRGHLAMLRLLLDNGAHVNTEMGDGLTPAIIAARNGHTEVLRLLVEKGAALDQVINYWGTPAYIAALYGHLDVLGLLVEKGAEMDAAPENSQRPLMTASKAGHYAIARTLVRGGAVLVKPGETTGASQLGQGGLRAAPELVVALMLDNRVLSDDEPEGAHNYYHHKKNFPPIFPAGLRATAR